MTKRRSFNRGKNGGKIPAAVQWPLRLTRLGMLAERVARAFWPLWSVLVLTAAGLMLGLHDRLPVEGVWGAALALALSAVVLLGIGLRQFHSPTRQEALDRLDASLKGRPIEALMDDQAIGGNDADSVAVWRAHQARMEQRAAAAKPVDPDLHLAPLDPFALRYAALVALAVALLFGSFARVGSVAGMTPGGAALASGPTWEGWIEPPTYTGLPVLYLADQTAGALEVPQGARITLRFYGEVGALTLTETVSGLTDTIAPASEPAQDFTVTQSGEIAVNGPGGRAWSVVLLADKPPSVAIAGEAEATVEGVMSLPFLAADDYAVTSGRARITLNTQALDRRYGLAAQPEERPAIEVELSMPINGKRSEFTEKMIEDFSQHPWANLPVRFELFVTDAANQQGMAPALETSLPARRFFDPLAGAIIEQRRDLLWTRQNAPRVAQVLRTVSHRPEEGLFRKETDYLSLRVILRRLEALTPKGLSVEQQDEIAAALWDLAVTLEEGDIGDALERMRQAQERLSEAMKNGASDEEIAELMQKLRDATQDYMRQLSRQAQQEAERNGEEMAESDPNAMQMTQDDLQKMMDRIQELMEQGRMAEAQQALEELQKLMENMKVTQGQGQGQQSPGQQAMEGLAETLRDQQGLSDQAFRDLQEQFNPGANQGQSQGNEGRNGGQGRGQSHEGQGSSQGEGQQDGQGEGQGQAEAEQPGQGQGSLADRQDALRRELDRQRGTLPGAGSEAGDAAREALDRAGRAMDGAENALRGNDLPEAIDRQAEAMEALREGMRNLGEAMAEAERQQRQGQQGEAMGRAGGQQQDPLGRQSGATGTVGSDDNLLQSEDVYRRARELLDEIRRRSGEGERPDAELEYLRRLLERF